MGDWGDLIRDYEEKWETDREIEKLETREKSVAKHCDHEWVDVGFGRIKKEVCRFCDIERTKAEKDQQ